jgi:hypothetical protein
MWTGFAPIPLADFCSNRLAGNNDLCPPALLSAGDAVIPGHGIGLTTASDSRNTALERPLGFSNIIVDNPRLPNRRF